MTSLDSAKVHTKSSPQIAADGLNKWLRCGIILQDPLIILSSASKKFKWGMLGCAGLQPQLFTKRKSLHLISFAYTAIPNVPRIIEDLRWAAVNLPLAHFCYLASDEEELYALREAGVDTIMGNINIFADEKVFRPLPDGDAPVRYDAVYDARFSPPKNHYLCSEIKKLALIYYSFQGMPDNEAEVRQILPHAHYINHEHGRGQYQKLSLKEVNVILNQSAVGLCLSHIEGAMRASIQYLLAGTPVVTVPSKGGRERFLLHPYAQLVKADTRCIALAVEKIKALNMPRAAVREYAATLISFERRNFLQALNLRSRKIFGSSANLNDFSVFFESNIREHRPLKESLKPLL